MNSELYSIIKSKNNDTEKYIFKLSDDSIVEAASFTYNGTTKKGLHICMPSQVGCPVGCRCCATTYSAIPFYRNLFASEIEDILSYIFEHKVNTNNYVISFSGHGEPLLNFENINFVANKCFERNVDVFITTTGIKEKLTYILENRLINYKFFISLHGSTDDERKKVIPYIPDISDLKGLFDFSNQIMRYGGKVVFNYMLTKFNTTSDSAKRVIAYLNNLKNPIEIRFINIFKIDNNDFIGYIPTESDISFFISTIEKEVKGTLVNFRVSKPPGNDMGVACGQTRANVLKNDSYH